MIDGMNLQVGKSIYTIPTISIQESFRLNAEEDKIEEAKLILMSDELELATDNVQDVLKEMYKSLLLQ